MSPQTAALRRLGFRQSPDHWCEDLLQFVLRLALHLKLLHPLQDFLLAKQAFSASSSTSALRVSIFE